MNAPAFLKNVPKKYLTAGIIAVIAFFGFTFYQFISFESTDDAFVDGHICAGQRAGGRAHR
jgi:multidrug resistance efflux pump